MREVIATGKTVEEATENGCAQLGLGRDQVSVEILEMPVKKLFKTTPAKVKVTSDEPEAAPAAEPEKKPAPQPKAEPKPAPARAEAPPPQAEAPQPARPAETAVLHNEPEESIDLAQNPAVDQAAKYLSSIFAAMGAGELSITALRQGEATLLRVEGEEIGRVIDTRGETIQALSYLTDRAVNKGVDKRDEAYLRIRLDVAGYRNRREGELIALAHRTAEEVQRTKRSRTLAPMNPYERLIIHTTIGSIDGVTSESIGADTERRVVVKSTAPDATDGEDWRPPRGNRDGGGRSRSGGHSRDRRGRGGPPREGGRGKGGGRQRTSSTPQREYADKPRNADAAPVVPERREAIRDGEDLPLYGKIDI